MGLRNLAWIEENRRKVDQMTGGELAHLARPHEQHRFAVEAPEDLPRELHRGRVLGRELGHDHRPLIAPQLASVWRAYNIQVVPAAGDIGHMEAAYLVDAKGLLPPIPAGPAQHHDRLPLQGACRRPTAA